MSGIHQVLSTNIVPAAGGGGYVPPSYVSTDIQLYYNPADSNSYSGSGSTITDLSGYNRTGTIVGNPSHDGTAFTFTDDYIMPPNMYAAGSTGIGHTVEAWVRPTATSAIWTDQGTTTPNTDYFTTGAEIYPTGPFYNVNTMLWNGTATTRTGGGISTLGAWINLVRTYNQFAGANTSQAYLNGVAASPVTFAWVPPWTQTPGNWYLGFGAQSIPTNFSTGAYFAGDYGIIRVYSRPLNQSEVTFNYNAAKSTYGL